MRTRLTSIVPLGVALLLTSTLGCFKPKWGTASPDPNILTIGAATYSSDADVSKGVFEKCEPHLEVAEEIATRAKVPAVLANEPSGGGKVLRLQITSIFAPKGGRYSGPKQIVLH